jgi:hypothetical protein
VPAVHFMDHFRDVVDGIEDFGVAVVQVLRTVV